MADKLRAQQQLESLQAKYVGTGHPDTTKWDWASNIQRDSLASFVGHPPILHYMAIGQGVAKERMRIQLLEKMVRPIGGRPIDPIERMDESK